MQIPTVKEVGAEMTMNIEAAETAESVGAKATRDEVFSELVDKYEITDRKWDPHEREYVGEERTRIVHMHAAVDVFYNKTNKFGDPIGRVLLNKLPKKEFDPEVWHGITLRQLRGIWANVDRRCEEENWEDCTGNPLTPNTVTLHDVKNFVVKPFTEPTKVSFVASLPSTGGYQFPRIHVSAPFTLTFRELVICVESFVHDFRTNFTEEHDIRGGGLTEDTPVWLVGFARSEWDKRPYGKPMDSPMAKSIEAAGNRVLSITDKDGKYFTRAWTTFESYLAINHRLWYIYTAHESKHHNGAVGLIPGGATSDIHPKDILNREKYFPTSLIVECIKHNLKNVTAEEESDRIHVLNTIIHSTDMDVEPLEVDDKYDTFYNNAFRAHFVTPGTLQASLLQDDGSWQQMLDVMKKGEMSMMRFDFGEGRGWDEITDDDATALIKHLPLTIKDLTIQCGSFNSHFIRALGDLIGESELTTLYLEDTLVNSFVDENTIKYFAKALEKNKELKHLQVWRENQKNKLKVWEEDVNIIETLVQSEHVAKALFTYLDDLFDEGNPDFAKIAFLLTLFMRLGRSFPECVNSMQSRKTLKWVEGLSEHTRAALFQSEAGSFVKNILNRKFRWRQNLVIVMLDLYVQLIIVAVLSSKGATNMTGKGNAIQGSYVWPLLFFCLLWITFRELMQMWGTYTKFYIKEACNWVDVYQIVVLFIILCRPHASIVYQLNAICVSWVALIFNLSNFWYPLSIFVTITVRILKGLVPFMFTAILLSFMFAHAFRALYANDGCDAPGEFQSAADEWNSCLTLGESYEKVVMMFLSSELWDFDGSGRKHARPLTCFYAFFMGVILLNMVIAVISEILAEVRSDAKNAFWDNRLSLIREIESLWPISPLIKQCFRVTEEFKSDNNHRFNFLRESSQGKNKDESSKFFNWWFAAKTQDCSCPNVAQRLLAIYSYSQWDDIIYPGEVFERVLLGLTHDTEHRQANTLSKAMVKILAWFLFFPTHIVIYIICLVSGLVSFGILWPSMMSETLFHVSTKSDVSEIKELNIDNDKLKEELRKDYYKLKRDIDNIKEDMDEGKHQFKGIKEDMAERQHEFKSIKEDITQLIDLVKDQMNR